MTAIKTPLKKKKKKLLECFLKICELMMFKKRKQ